MRNKLLSRKFWVMLAAVLGSLGTGVSGIIVGNQTLAIVGSCLTVISAAIYAGVEAYCDGKSIEANANTDEESTIGF